MIGRKLSTSALVGSLAALAAVGSCRDQATTGPGAIPSRNYAANLRLQSGDLQVGPVSQPLPQTLTVKVVDAGGGIVQGANVTWVVVAGGGSVIPPTGISDALGYARTSWTLGPALGANTVRAYLYGAYLLDSATFTATAAGGSGSTSTTIRIISGDGQVGGSAQLLPLPLVVEARDGSGNLAAGVPVTFTQAATNLDGFTSPAPVTTGADGRASVSWTLGHNTTNGTVQMSVTASPEGVPAAAVVFRATSRPQYRMQRVTTPFQQTDTTGATIGAPNDYLAGVRDTLRVQVYDPSDSTGVQGIAVTWATQNPDVDGVPVNATSVTDNFGFAKTLWVLRKPGGFAIPPSTIAKRMFATAAGIGQVEFQAKVTAGHICGVTLSPIAGSPAVGSSNAVTATVTDCNSYPIPGALVTFSTVDPGGSVSPNSVATNLFGSASATWKLGTIPGVQTLNATATDPSGGPPVTSSIVVTAVPVPAGSVVLVGAVATPQAAGTPVLVQVRVKDVNGNDLPGFTVSFAATNTGTTPGTVAASATTAADGTASVVWTLGNTGTNTLTVTAGGAPPLVVTVIVP